MHHAITHQCPGTPINQLVYEGSIIALYNFLPYYVNDIVMAEKLEHEENLHVIHFSLIDNCQLKENKTTISETEIDVPHMKNITALYLLPGSEISYNICALTNAQPQSGVRLEVYMLTDLEKARDFNPRQSYIYKNFPVCSQHDDKPCSCHTFTYKVKESNYYSAIFIPRQNIFTIDYNYTSTIQKVSIASYQNSSLHTCSVSGINDQCSFEIANLLPHQMVKEQCIIADIEVNEVEKSSYLHISVTPTCSKTQLGVSISFLVFGVLVLIIILCLWCYVKRSKK